jgi:RNA polymerase sigma-70 factor (ECF subfamily)
MATDDKDLVKRCQADPAAFEELMRRYKRCVFAYAMASTGSRSDAEEVTQDVFVKVYRAAHRFNSHYSFTTWLYAIASNTCKNKLRGRHRQQGNVSLDSEESPVIALSHESDPLDAYRRQVEFTEVRDAIGGLPPRYREVLYLRYVEGLSYKGIAEVLGLSLGNVEARIFRGKEKVRQKLAAQSRKGEPGPQAGPGED